MKRSEAARYARWSATVAFALAAVTIVVYLNRDWRRYLEGKKAPPPTPLDVSRQSNGISFKKVEKERTIFAVEASRSTEFKDQDASLLEEVKITIFGKSEERHDVIRTHSCRYSKADGAIACSGDVQMDLLSAADAARTAGNEAAAKALTVHVETRKVTFDRGSGVARTDAPVTFVFPGGSGDAVGMEYKTDEGTVRLLRAVRFSLTEPEASAGKTAGGGNMAAGTRKAVASFSGPNGISREVHVTAASLDFGRDTRLLLLHGPAEAMTAKERLTAGEISLALDKDFHAEKLIAAAGGNGERPTIVSPGAPSQAKLEANVLTAYFAAGGDVTKVEANGKVHGWRAGATEKNEMTAEKGVVDLWPKVGQPKLMNLSGNVVVKTEIAKAESTRVLRTEALQIKFGEARLREPSKPQKAETLSAGTVEWTDAASSGGIAGAGGTGQEGKGTGRAEKPQGAGGAKTKLQAGKLEMDFGAQGKAKQLLATENVHTERTLPGKTVQTATANSGVAELLETGGWSRMNLQGNVKLVDGDRTGQAERAVFERAAQTALLAGQAVARDATTETRAPQITFAQASGDIRAAGGVRSTDFSVKGSGVQLASGPVNVTADTLQANSKNGRAVYTGHARLWQGESVMEAESIEMQREKGLLIATGRVRAVFPQAPAQTATQSPGKPSAATVASGGAGKSGGTIVASILPSKKMDLWHATCGVLTYLEKEGRAHLEKDVVVQSAAQRMRGPVLDLYFTRSEQTGGVTTASGKNPPSGSQQISKAVGTGGVVVEEGGRKATAERGEYIAADGKFVMSGGNPTIYDGSAGTTTGRQLTFFLADDTIIVDSEKGTQTLTKHRVQK